MKKFLVFLLVLLSFSCISCTKDDDNNNSGGDDNNVTHNSACEELGISKNFKIIGGTTCSTAKSPIVEILVTNSTGTGICSGTIISSNTVLTAAHCFEDNVTSIKVIAGGKTYDATGYAVHSQYLKNPSPSSTAIYDRNDLGLVQIGSAFGITPIPVITSRSPSVGESLMVAGYGQDESGTTEVLKATYMTVSEVFTSGFVLPYDTTHTNVCFGDSGGPAFGYVNGVLGVFGVTSSGTVTNCLEGDKTFFPKISFSENTSFVVNNSGAKTI